MKRLLIILVTLNLCACSCGGSCDECEFQEDSDCILQEGDVVTFKVADKKFIIDDVYAYSCSCECIYSGHYFNNDGERQSEAYVNEYELIIPDSLREAREYD